MTTLPTMPMMDTHGVEVKNVKTFMGLECPGFNATVYVDGKRVATAIDQGDGGSVFLQPLVANGHHLVEERADRWDTARAHQFERLGIFLAKIIDQRELVRQAARNAKKGYVVTLRMRTKPYQFDPEDEVEYDEVRTVGLKTPAGIAAYVANHPDAVFDVVPHA